MENTVCVCACVVGCSVPAHAYVMHDALHGVVLPAHTGYRVLITALRHQSAEWLSQQDRTALLDAGFILPPVPCTNTVVTTIGPIVQGNPGAPVPGGGPMAVPA